MNIAEIRKNYPMYSDMSDGELVRGLHKKFYSDVPYSDFLKKIDFREPEKSPTEEMSAAQKFNAGAGKFFYDLGQGAAQMVGSGESGAETAARRKADAPLTSSIPGFLGNVGAGIATLAPTALLSGAATIPGAAALGTVIGGLQPATSTSERATNMAAGGFLGGGLQAVTYAPQIASKVGEIGRALKEPLTDEGQKQIVGRALRRATGGQDQEVIANLQAAKELVPGSSPTTGQAAGNAGIAALERTAVATNPAVMELHRQQLANQNAARVAALQEMAGTSGERKMMGAVREMMTELPYQEARQTNIPQPVADAMRPQIDNLLERPAMKKAISRAKEIFGEESIDLAKGGSVKGLQYTKQALDDIIERASGMTSSIGKNELRALQQTRTDLIKVLDEVAPKLRGADVAYSQWSKPINQMDVAQFLADKSINPLTGDLRGQAFARNLTDDAAASATNFGRATLENTMTPKQLGILSGIKEDLARAQFAQTAGRGVGSDTVQKLAMSNLLGAAGAERIPTLLSRPAMLANWLLGKTYSTADREMALQLAEAMLNPQTAAEIMKNVKSLPPTVSPELQKKLGFLAGSLGTPMIPAAVNQ